MGNLHVPASLNELVIEPKCIRAGIVPESLEDASNDRSVPCLIRPAALFPVGNAGLRLPQPKEVQMQQPRDIAARRLSMIVEQYVEARKRHFGFVSTDQA
ncbi:MAG: hypothetical protein E5W64_10755, partial [Mesorhizobium sp.]